MPSKKAKSANSSKAPTSFKGWEPGLLAAQFEEEQWNAGVYFVVGERQEVEIFTESLATAIRVPQRKLFSVISWDEMIMQINTLTNPKKSDDLPMFYEITEATRVILSKGEELSLPLVGKLLKFYLLWIKQKDMKRRENERRAMEEKDEPKGSSAGSKKKSDRKASSKSKGKAKKTPDPPSFKLNTKLKKRDEEEVIEKFIDDEPDDGPKHYIIIIGFHHLQLLFILAELGINITAVIKISAENLEILPKQDSLLETNVSSEANEAEMQQREAQKLKKEKTKDDLNIFWKYLEAVLNIDKHEFKLFDVARLQYTVKESIYPQDWTNNEMMMEFGTTLFEDIACLIYDCIDSKRQYLNYINNMQMCVVPEAFKSEQVLEQQIQPVKKKTPPSGQAAGQAVHTEQEPTPTEVDMRYYNDLMNLVPLESLSVPLILHCILEQIIASEENRTPPSEFIPKPREDGLNPNIIDHIISVVLKLSVSEKEKKKMIEELQDSKHKKENEINEESEFGQHPTSNIDVKSNKSSLLKIVVDGDLENQDSRDSNHTNSPTLGKSQTFQDLESAVNNENIPHTTEVTSEAQFESFEANLTGKGSTVTNRTLPGDSKEKVTEDINETAQKKLREEPSQPLLLNHHDNLTWRTHHLKIFEGFDTAKVEQEIMKKLLVAQAFNFSRPSPEDDKKRLAGIQELMFYCTNERMTNSEVERIVKQFVFESMKLTGVKKNGELEKRDKFFFQQPESESSYIPWDDPVRFAKDMRDFLRVTKMDILHVEPEQCAAQTTEETQTCPFIFKSSTLKDSRKQSGEPCTSVHFENVNEMLNGSMINKSVAKKDECKEAKENLTVDLEAIQSVQLRSLNEWCFAEHHEPYVLLQVLEEAIKFYRYVDPYYHRQDNSLLLVLHNPMNNHRQCQESWNIALHSNVGFRSYLEHVASSISDWVEEEEIKYKAEMLANEIEQLNSLKAIPETQMSSPRESLVGRKRTPKKSIRSSASSKAEEEDKMAETFIREGSLKAWKVEQEKQKEEELKKDKKGKKGRMDIKKKLENKERSDSASSRHSTVSSKKSPEYVKEEQDKSSDVEEAQESPMPAEKIYKFIGYDLGNDIIQISGHVKSLFPADGGHIRVNTSQFLYGLFNVQVCVMKDKHLFFIYITDPFKNVGEGNENTAENPESKSSETEKESTGTSPDIELRSTGTAHLSEPEGSKNSSNSKSILSEGVSTKPPEVNVKDTRISAFGSFFAVLDDGIILTLSKPNSKNDSKVEEDQLLASILNTPSVQTPTTLPITNDVTIKNTIVTPKSGKLVKSPKSGKINPKKENASLPSVETLEKQEESKPEVEQPDVPAEGPEPVPELPTFLSLSACSPDGLVVTFFTESSIGITSDEVNPNEKILVRQSYPIKTNGSQPCEAARKWPAMEEMSRVITSDGTVVKYMIDGSTQVLFPDGTVSKSPDSGPITLPVPIQSVRSQFEFVSQDSKDSKELRPETVDENPKRGKHARKSISVPTPSDTGVSQINQLENTLEHEPGTWLTTIPNGQIIGTKGKETLDTKPILFYKATDLGTQEVMITRQDKVITVLGNNSTIVEHADATRISTYYQDVKVPFFKEGYKADNTAEQTTKEISYIMIECVGFATVIMNPEENSCCTMFGNGTTIVAKSQGTYQIFPASVGSLSIDQEGCAMYSSISNNSVPIDIQQGTYIMNYTSQVICEVIDQEGNDFQVMVDGTTFPVVPADTEEIEQEDEQFLLNNHNQKSEPVTYEKHAPRFFILHDDLSGTELLRSSEVEEYLFRAYCNPATAVLKERLPEFPGVLGITFLQPATEDIGSRWLIKKEIDNIVPPNLQSRKWDKFPSVEQKTPGPIFGTNICDLSLQNVPSPPLPVLKCPPVLEVRQLFQYESVSIEVRHQMQNSLKGYIEQILQKEQEVNEMIIKEPRSEEERIQAADLLKLVLSYPDNEESQIEEKEPSKVDVASIYEHAVAPIQSPTEMTKCVQLIRGSEHKHESQWPQRLEEYRQELCEAKNSQLALKNMIIPPYFQSEMGMAFIANQGPDVNCCSKHVSGCPPMKASCSVVPYGSASTSCDSDPVLTSDVCNQPLNPTPIHASQRDSCSKGSSESMPQIQCPHHPQGGCANQFPQSSCKNSRKGSPTSQSAGNMVCCPEKIRNLHCEYGFLMYKPEELPIRGGNIILNKNLVVDPLGQPRKEKIRLPSAILGSKPGCLQNQKFAAIEDPVRRKVNTASIAGPLASGLLKEPVRGFELFPREVNFGVLREGFTYAYAVLVKNIGVDSCRFRVKPPPPGTGLRLCFKPGPVAAGLNTELEIEFYAMAIGLEGTEGIGYLCHHLEIQTETEAMFLPITATILTDCFYENRPEHLPKGGRSPGVRLICTNPGTHTGIMQSHRSTAKSAVLLEPGSTCSYNMCET